MEYVVLRVVAGLVCVAIIFYFGTRAGRRWQWAETIDADYEARQAGNALIAEANRKTYEAQMAYNQLAGKIPAAMRVPDPSGARAVFFNKERQPLLEVNEELARQAFAAGKPVFLHPFDPIQISHFDANGFQAWTVEGGRIEGVRWYIDYPPEAFQKIPEKGM